MTMARSSPAMMAHRSSPSRSFLLAPTALRGLHLERLPHGGPNRQPRGRARSARKTIYTHKSKRISYTKFLTEPQSMGRTGSALDKAWVSHCTSWRGLGGNSVSERASLSGDESWVVGGGRFEQWLVLVVGLVRGEQSGVVPVLDGGAVHAEPFGDLVHVEQTASARSRSMWLGKR